MTCRDAAKAPQYKGDGSPVTAADLGPDSVGSSELQTGSVRASELGGIIQVQNDTTIKANDNASVSVQCPAGTTVISGAP